MVFDESIFPLASLHENAGTRLRREVLLLPDHLLNSTGDDSRANVTNNHNHGSSAVQDLQEVP